MKMGGYVMSSRGVHMSSMGVRNELPLLLLLPSMYHIATSSLACCWRWLREILRLHAEMNFFAWPGPVVCFCVAKLNYGRQMSLVIITFYCVLWKTKKSTILIITRRRSGIPIEKMALAYCVTSFISGDETTLFMYSSFPGEIDFFLASWEKLLYESDLLLMSLGDLSWHFIKSLDML